MSKITLRPISIDDTQNVLRWRNSEAVRQFFIYRQEITREMHENWLATKVANGEVIQFIIHDENLGKDIGSTYLENINRTHNQAELGIFIGESNELGHGVGLQAINELLTYAFDELELHKVYLRVLEKNERAIRCYEKAGMKKEAFLRDEVFLDGEYENVILMAILQDEYQNRGRQIGY